MRRIISLASIILIVCLIFTACGSQATSTSTSTPGGGSDKKPVEIEFLYIHGGTSGEVIKQLASDFNQKQDKIVVTPVYVEGSYEGALEKLQALAAVDQLPELTQAGYQYTNYMIENMPVVPVYQFIDKEKYDTSDYFPNMLDLGKYTDGKQYGLCIAVSNPVLYL